MPEQTTRRREQTLNNQIPISLHPHPKEKGVMRFKHNFQQHIWQLNCIFHYKHHSHSSLMKKQLHSDYQKTQSSQKQKSVNNLEEVRRLNLQHSQLFIKFCKLVTRSE